MSLGAHWRVFCVCGTGARVVFTAGAADRAVEWHVKVEGAEGADHVMTIEYRDPRVREREKPRWR